MGGVVETAKNVLTPVKSILDPVSAITTAISGAQGLFGSSKQKSSPPQGDGVSPFNPVKPTAIARPSSLGDYASFTPDQERSALATKGLNQGLGGDEDSYYRNLIQRSLIGDDNKPAADTNSLLPVESQYFSQKGLNTSGIMEFLKQLQGAQ